MLPSVFIIYGASLLTLEVVLMPRYFFFLLLFYKRYQNREHRNISLGELSSCILGVILTLFHSRRFCELFKPNFIPINDNNANNKCPYCPHCCRSGNKYHISNLLTSSSTGSATNVCCLLVILYATELVS